MISTAFDDLDLLGLKDNDFNANLLTFFDKFLYLGGFRFDKEIGMFMKYPA